MRILKAVLLSLLMAFPGLAQIPAPQIPLSGNVGCAGFPCSNSGTLVMSTDANRSMTAQETSATNIKVMSSVSLTATRNLIAPSGKFPFAIENATSGGQSIQIIGPSGTGVTIPNGQAVSVWNDGTNYVQVGSSANGTVVGQQYRIAGFTGAGSGASTGIGNTGVSVDAATSSQLYRNSIATPPTDNTLTIGTDSVTTTMNFVPGGVIGGTITISRPDVMVGTDSGFNHGNDGISPQQLWQVITAQNENLNFHGAGIHGGGGGQLTCSGVGDCHSRYFYAHGYGGKTGASDEGLQGAGVQPSEVADTYAGTVATGGSGATTITVTCVHDCGNPGVGRFVGESRPTVLRSFATAMTTTAITVNDAVPVSTAYGTLTSNVAVNNPPVPGDLTTWQSTSITLPVTFGSFAVGDIICFDQTYTDETKITAVTALSGGSQTITAPLHQSHYAGGKIYANGACGTGVDFDANVFPQGGGVVLHYPLVVAGSTDAHTLQMYQSGAIKGNVDLTALSGGGNGLGTITRTSGVVTINIAEASDDLLPSQADFIGTTLSIRGSSVTSLNGTCTTSTHPAIGILRCNQSGADTSDATQTAFVTIGDTGYGNSRFELLNIAEVVDVRDLANINLTTGATTGAVLDNTLHLTPNNMALTVGEAISEHHHPLFQVVGIANAVGMINPLNGSSALTSNILQNGSSPGVYEAHNANFLPLDGPGQVGTFRDGIYAYGTADKYSPTFAGFVHSVGCPPTTLGCSDPAFHYDFKMLSGLGFNSLHERWTPATGTLTSNIGSSQQQSYITQTPTGSTGILNNYATSHFHTWSFTADGGFLFDTSPVCTTATGCGTPSVAHSDYAFIPASTSIVGNTILGPVYLEATQVHFKALIVRLSGTTTCPVAPVVSFMDLGTSPTTTFSSATSVTSLTTGTTAGVYQTTGNVNLALGDYFGFAFTGGTCSAAPQFDITVQVQ